MKMNFHEAFEEQKAMIKFNQVGSCRPNRGVMEIVGFMSCSCMGLSPLFEQHHPSASK